MFKAYGVCEKYEHIIKRFFYESIEILPFFVHYLNNVL